jgi:MoaA/NifB/PqqE/SkfB family radical SAM enzyme
VNSVFSFLHHLGGDNPQRWYPLLSVYYLTYACDFRCPYCCDGTGQPYYRLHSPILAGRQVIELLRRVRQHCGHLVITGGEPLQHPEVGNVMAALGALRFRTVVLTTNGYALDAVLPAVAPTVSHLVVSLQTLQAARADAEYGLGCGTHERILRNIETASHLRGRRFEVVISSVATPENIEDLYDVARYCRERAFRLAVCPQLVGVKAHPALIENPAYRRLYDFLIAEKKKGAKIQGTVDYLEHMRDLRKFECRPFTMLVVSPVGDVFYPCLEIGHAAANLFDENNLHRLRQQARATFGEQPDCDTRCHSACALGFSRLLANPLSLLHEGALLARAGIKNVL